MQGLMSSSHSVTDRRVVCVCTCSIRFVQELYTFEIYSRQLVKHGGASFSSLCSLSNLTVEEHLTQHCDATGVSCLASKSLQALNTCPFTKFAWQRPSYLRDIRQWLDVLGPGRHYRYCEYNTLHGRACTYTSTSDLFSAFSYIILISDAREQSVNSAAVSDKTQVRPCVRQQG